jgi:hypothetical protein
MIEGSGSGRPKNLRIRIRHTALNSTGNCKYSQTLKGRVRNFPESEPTQIHTTGTYPRPHSDSSDTLRTHVGGGPGYHPRHPPPPPHHFRGGGGPPPPFRGRPGFFRGRGGSGYFPRPGRGFRGGFWRGPLGGGGGGPLYGRKVTGEYERLSAGGGDGEPPSAARGFAEEGEEEPPDAVYAVSGDQVKRYTVANAPAIFL